MKEYTIKILILSRQEPRDHPTLADESMNLLRETLEGRMALFEELDHFVHIRADSIREAAANQNMSKVLEQYQIVTQACVSCHAAFQDEIRRAKIGRASCRERVERWVVAVAGNEKSKSEARRRGSGER